MSSCFRPNAEIYILIRSGDHAADKVQSVSVANVGHMFLAIVCDECVNDQCSVRAWVTSISQGRCQYCKWQSSGLVKDPGNMDSIYANTLKIA